MNSNNNIGGKYTLQRSPKTSPKLVINGENIEKNLVFSNISIDRDTALKEIIEWVNGSMTSLPINKESQRQCVEACKLAIQSKLKSSELFPAARIQSSPSQLLGYPRFLYDTLIQHPHFALICEHDQTKKKFMDFIEIKFMPTTSDTQQKQLFDFIPREQYIKHCLMYRVLPMKLISENKVSKEDWNFIRKKIINIDKNCKTFIKAIEYLNPGNKTNLFELKNSLTNKTLTQEEQLLLLTLDVLQGNTKYDYNQLPQADNLNFLFSLALYCIGNNDYDNAMKFLKSEQKVENQDVIFYIGLFYRSGIAEQENPQQAFECFQQASNLGHTEAKYKLAQCYKIGYGVDKNDKEAGKLLQECAKNEHKLAKFELYETDLNQFGFLS